MDGRLTGELSMLRERGCKLTQPGRARVLSAVTMLAQYRGLLVPRDVFQGPRGMQVDSTAGRANRSEEAKVVAETPLEEPFFHLAIQSLIQHRCRALTSMGQC